MEHIPVRVLHGKIRLTECKIMKLCELSKK